MTEPESDDSSAYPSSWKPQYIRDREEAAQIHPHELEMFLAAMDKRELTLLLQRIEQMR